MKAAYISLALLIAWACMAPSPTPSPKNWLIAAYPSTQKGPHDMYYLPPRPSKQHFYDPTTHQWHWCKPCQQQKEQKEQ